MRKANASYKIENARNPKKKAVVIISFCSSGNGIFPAKLFQNPILRSYFLFLQFTNWLWQKI